MGVDAVLAQASAGTESIPEDWMPATGVRALVFEDPVLLWLEFHGDANGFTKDAPQYDFTEFIHGKGRQFEEKWIAEMAPDAVRVCEETWEVRQLRALKRTVELIAERTQVIAAPALWWAPEHVYGVPDLIARGEWVRHRFPDLELGSDTVDHYFVLDVKFTTELDASKKKLDLVNFAAQVRLYSYMVGRLTGTTASEAYIICRDRVENPLRVEVTSTDEGALESDLRKMRDRYLDIKQNGASYKPGTDQRIEANLQRDRDGHWRSAKARIARDCTPGGDPCQIYYISASQRQTLADYGYDSLEKLLAEEPARVPLESCKGLGPARCPQIRAILEANKLGTVVPKTFATAPPRADVELYVDFEFFTDLNVDFDRQWPALEGHEMIFMVGVGWEGNGDWNFEAMTADSESTDGERRLLEQFGEFVRSQTHIDEAARSSLALYHWTSAEVSQLRSACDRHGLPSEHMLRHLPWFDLEKKVFLKEPIGIPGTFKYGLKGVATALQLVDWPGNVADGLAAMVAGWRAYGENAPLESPEMAIIQEYNEVDCRALYEIVKWLRSR